MKTYRTGIGGIILAAILLTLRTPQTVAASEQPENQDPPDRVARLNYVSGSVSFQPGGEGDWVQAVINRPLTRGDNLWTDKNSRAELHVGSTAIRTDSETSLTLLDLDDQTMQFRLSLGSIIVQLRHLDDGDLVEVDTPNLAFSLQREGEYRIDVNSGGDQTVVTAWRGRGEVTGGGSSFIVLGGQQARFRGTDELTHDIAMVGDPDDFDKWAFARDIHEQQAEASGYISNEMTGYEDLDDYGRWDYGDEGLMWIPNELPVGWAPFQVGEWNWIEPWGWTWVDAEPWGFAPFHYGRWTHADGGWCWIPGPVFVKHVYMPAPVVFVTGGGHSPRSGSGPAVAWFPLGPHEIYVPPYTASGAYLNKVNLTNTHTNLIQITNFYNAYTLDGTNSAPVRYINQRIPNGVTAVSEDTFINARSVRNNIVHLDAKDLAESSVTYRSNVQPVKASVLGIEARARAKPLPEIENRQVVATRMPPNPREPFEEREPAVNVRTEAPHLESAAHQPHPIPPSLSSPLLTARMPEFSRPPQSKPSLQEQSAAPAKGASSLEGTMSSVGGQPSDGRTGRATVIPHDPVVRSFPRVGEAPNPLVRPAPPVGNADARQQQNEARKFRAWQDQRRTMGASHISPAQGGASLRSELPARTASPAGPSRK
jgi:hypothetical protein